MVLAEGVGFTYPGGAQILDGVSFAIQAGSSVSIAGRNGAGKSTLLRLINGLLKPTAGRLLVAGVQTETTSASSLARHVATVFQSPEQQIFTSRVIDEVSFGPRQLRLSRPQIDERVESALVRTGLASLAGVHPYDLPHATRKFVALASALAMRPRLLLLDEPQQGLDAAAIARLEVILREEQSAGTTLLFVCHDMDFIARTADQLLVFGEGRLLGQGETSFLFADASLIAQAGLHTPDILRLSQRLQLPSARHPQELIEQWQERRCHL
jgi:energy-coupling factor transport system ATP-binding protein